MSDFYCLHWAHLRLLLCLGSRFTLKKICQPLLCFVEWIKTWKRDYKSDSPSNNINYPYQGHRYHQEILKICCPSDRSLANLSSKRIVIIRPQSSSLSSPCSGLISGSGSGTLLCEDVSAITGGGGLGCRGSESSQAASARPRTSECR